MNIEIELRNETDALNTFNKNRISESLDNYLMTLLEYKPFKEKIKLAIYSDNNASIEKVIHNYYKEKYIFYKKIDNSDNYIRLVLLLIAIILIFISTQLLAIFSEIFLIAGWVIVWEVVYDIIFRSAKRKRKKNIYKALANCQINIKKCQEHMINK